MNAKPSISNVMSVFLCFAILTVLSAQPIGVTVVSNVQASQRTDGSMIVDISYDLLTANPEGTFIAVEVSPDGGASWRIPHNLSGDVGQGIEAAMNRQVAWDAGEETPDKYWLNCLVKVSAREPITIMLKFNVPMDLMKISSGSFMMGRYPGEQDSNHWEDHQHQVNISYDFYLGRYPVTKIQWEAMMGTTPWDGKDNILDHSNSPAVYISWNDIRETDGFLDKLNDYLVSTEQPYEVRLPSEAEWEYSARAGTTTRFYWGDDPSYTEIDDYAWYVGNTHNMGNSHEHIVGQKLPNGWGLYDMSGNVFEWCEDDSHSNYTGAPADGSAWVDSPRAISRMRRGGGWGYPASHSRSANRTGTNPDVRGGYYAFRVLAVPK